MKTLRWRSTASLAAFLAFMIGFWARPGLQAATLTDRFADRPVAGGTLASFDGDSTLAGSEVGEPDHGGARRRTLWSAWTAPGSGTVTITTSTGSSTFNTVLAVYAGTALTNLFPVAQNDDVEPGFRWSEVTFPTKAGVTYSDRKAHV